MKELTFEDIQQMHQAAKNYNCDRRQDAQDELYFYWISHYDDAWRQALPLRFQGQFDMLRKSGRKIIADITSNMVQADFQPIDGTPEEMGDFLDRMYRTDARRNDSREAFHNAITECIPCGIGGWRLTTEYETDLVGDTKQVIRRQPIYEFNATVFFDPAARRIDKSDAKWVQVLTAYSEDEYKELREEYGDSDESYSGPGMVPITSNAGLWRGDQDLCYVVEHYQRYKKKVTVIFYTDLFGTPVAFYEDDVKERGEELAAAGYVEQSRKTITRWCVEKYIVGHDGVLERQKIVGTELPIIPFYGERAYVNGLEHYEGLTRLAQDQQRLHNFMLSYLADIVSTSPRPKPIFYQEQIAGYEGMYAENGADNNYPYYLQNRYDEANNELPFGPVAQMPEQKMPDALITAIQLMRESMGDVSQSGAPNSIADVDLSGNAVSQLRAMLDEQSMTYRSHYEFAIRRDAEIYAGMVPDVYDVPRKVVLTGQDGSREDAFVMESIIDLETGDNIILNDLRTAKFQVFAEMGAAYESQKQQQRQEITTMLQTIPPDHPTYSALLYKYIQLSDGVENQDLKEFAKRQLITSGIKKPETDEEKQMLAEVQQQAQQPDANMALALAEQEKARADMAGVEVDAFNAETNRIKVMNERIKLQIEAQKAGLDMEFTEAKITGTRIDNMQKLYNPKNMGSGQTA